MSDYEKIVQGKEDDIRIVLSAFKKDNVFYLEKYDWKNPDPGHPASRLELLRTERVGINDESIPDLINALQDYVTFRKKEAEESKKYFSKWIKRIEEVMKSGDK